MTYTQKIILSPALTLFVSVILLGSGTAHASVVTGTLSGGTGSGSSVSGTLSGSTGGSSGTLSGSVTGGSVGGSSGGGGGGGILSGSLAVGSTNGGGSGGGVVTSTGGLVLGTSTEAVTADPGLPDTGGGGAANIPSVNGGVALLFGLLAAAGTYMFLINRLRT